MARQRKRTNPIISALIFIVVAVILLIFGVKEFVGLHGDLLNVSTCDPSEITEGTYVEATLTTGYGKYIEKTTTYNHTVTRTDGYYYLVDVCDKNEDGSAKDSASWIGVSVDKADSDKYESISNDDNPSPVYIKGLIKKNSSEIQGYLDDYLESYIDMYASTYGITLTDEDYSTIKAEALPYYIQVKTSFDYLFDFGLGALFLIIGVIFLLVGIKKKKANTAAYQGTASTGTATYQGDYSNYTGSGSDYVDPIYNQQPANNTPYGTQYDPYSATPNDSQQSQYTSGQDDSQQNPYS